MPIGKWSVGEPRHRKFTEGVAMRVQLLKVPLVVLVAVVMSALVLGGCTGSDTSTDLPDTLENVEQQANQAAREANLKMIDSAIEIYYNSTGEYPTSMKQLVPEYLMRMPEDPMGGTYYIKKKGGGAEAAVK